MRLDFMTPEVWNGLVIGVTLIGLAFAVLRLLRDWNRYQWYRRRSERQAGEARQGVGEFHESDGNSR